MRFVLHPGAVVNNNAHVKWQHVAEAYSPLDGAVPNALSPGNHDSGSRGDASPRDTLLNEYVDYRASAERPSCGGADAESGRGGRHALARVSPRRCERSGVHPCAAVRSVPDRALSFLRVPARLTAAPVGP